MNLKWVARSWGIWVQRGWGIQLEIQLLISSTCSKLNTSPAFGSFKNILSTPQMVSFPVSKTLPIMWKEIVWPNRCGNSLAQLVCACSVTMDLNLKPSQPRWPMHFGLPWIEKKKKKCFTTRAKQLRVCISQTKSRFFITLQCPRPYHPRCPILLNITTSAAISGSISLPSIISTSFTQAK